MTIDVRQRIKGLTLNNAIEVILWWSFHILSLKSSFSFEYWTPSGVKREWWCSRWRPEGGVIVFSFHFYNPFLYSSRGMICFLKIVLLPYSQLYFGEKYLLKVCISIQKCFCEWSITISSKEWLQRLDGKIWALYLIQMMGVAICYQFLDQGWVVYSFKYNILFPLCCSKELKCRLVCRWFGWSCLFSYLLWIGLLSTFFLSCWYSLLCFLRFIVSDYHLLNLFVEDNLFVVV